MTKLVQGFIKTISIFLGAVLVLAALALVLLVYLNSPPAEPPRVREDNSSLRIEENGFVRIEIRPGESGRSVGQRLESASLIRTRYFWDLLSYIDKEYIKAGIYRFSPPKTQFEIRSILVEGKQILVRVTVPEGVTLKKTARLMAEAGICNEAAFLEAASDEDIRLRYHIPGETMEGYLYPDTYLFPQNYPASEVVKTMTETFFKRIAGIQGDARPLSPRELNDRVILASIVEREYRAADEAPFMAGVFYNRLRIGMALQSCATVEYIITEVQGKPHPERLFERDTKIPDPYNTYVRPGLPPGPISAPGEVALNAVFHPRDSDYLYFRLVNPAEGRHYFSRTLDDHIRAGVLYVKGRA
jgi:UPF0755 protein